MEHQKRINDIIKDTPKAAPCFVYEIEGSDKNRLLSFAPISKGDYVTIKLTDGTFLKDKMVKKVLHYSSVMTMEDQILNSIITLED